MLAAAVRQPGYGEVSAETSDSQKRYLVGLYDDDDTLLKAVHAIKAKGLKIANVFTPFPVHGLEHELDYRDSRLPDVAFVFGACGTTLALLMQIWMYGIDWQVNVGGKPTIPLPSFIPVTFELTILLGSLGMVFTYLFVNKLAPWVTPVVVDPRQTDDRFVVLIPVSEHEADNQKARQAYHDTGAVEVREQLLDDSIEYEEEGGHDDHHH